MSSPLPEWQSLKERKFCGLDKLQMYHDLGERKELGPVKDGNRHKQSGGGGGLGRKAHSERHLGPDLWVSRGKLGKSVQVGWARVPTPHVDNSWHSDRTERTVAGAPQGGGCTGWEEFGEMGRVQSSWNLLAFFYQLLKIYKFILQNKQCRSRTEGLRARRGRARSSGVELSGPGINPKSHLGDAPI